jgi:hypothetical protein
MIGDLRRATTLAVSALFSLCTGLSAQTDRVPAGLPRAFVGAGVVPATSDADARMRLFGERSSLVWFIEGGAALSPRIGLGAEFAQPTAVTASTSGRSFNASGRQEERVLMGLVRGRVWAIDRVAFDVVGGVGLLFQHHELRFAPCFTGCPDTARETLNRHAPAVAVGAEVPIRIGRHVAVTGIARYYALRRGEHVSEVPVVIPWQYEWRSSARFGLGVTGRAVW